MYAIGKNKRNLAYIRSIIPNKKGPLNGPFLSSCSKDSLSQNLGWTGIFLFDEDLKTVLLTVERPCRRFAIKTPASTKP